MGVWSDIYDQKEIICSEIQDIISERFNVVLANKASLVSCQVDNGYKFDIEFVVTFTNNNDGKTYSYSASHDIGDYDDTDTEETVDAFTTDEFIEEIYTLGLEYELISEGKRLIREKLNDIKESFWDSIANGYKHGLISESVFTECTNIIVKLRKDLKNYKESFSPEYVIIVKGPDEDFYVGNSYDGYAPPLVETQGEAQTFSREAAENFVSKYLNTDYINPDEDHNAYVLAYGLNDYGWKIKEFDDYDMGEDFYGRNESVKKEATKTTYIDAMYNDAFDTLYNAFISLDELMDEDEYREIGIQALLDNGWSEVYAEEVVDKFIVENDLDNVEHYDLDNDYYTESIIDTAANRLMDVNDVIYLDGTEDGSNAPLTITKYIIPENNPSMRLIAGTTALVRGRIVNARQNNIEEFLKNNYEEVSKEVVNESFNDELAIVKDEMISMGLDPSDTDDRNYYWHMKGQYAVESNRKITEGTNQKRITRYGAFDNGYVLHSYSDISNEEAEEIARKKSMDNPNDIFYVKYDDIMNPCSDLRWFNGKSYHFSEISIQNGVPTILANENRSIIESSQYYDENWWNEFNSIEDSNERSKFFIKRFHRKPSYDELFGEEDPFDIMAGISRTYNDYELAESVGVTESFEDEHGISDIGDREIEDETAEVPINLEYISQDGMSYNATYKLTTKVSYDEDSVLRCKVQLDDSVQNFNSSSDSNYASITLRSFGAGSVTLLITLSEEAELDYGIENDNGKALLDIILKGTKGEGSVWLDW